jgi:hypothetical protein
MKAKLFLSGLAFSMTLMGGNAFAASTVIDTYGAGALHTGNTYAGGINIKLDGTTINGEAGGNVPNSSLAGKALSFVYCIDLLHSININATYNAFYNNKGQLTGRPEITATNGGKIAWLVTHQAQTATTKEQQAGLQAAIWKQVYGNRFELLSTTGSAIKTAYNNYIAALGSNTASVKTVLWIDPRSGSNNTTHNQDLVAWGAGFKLPTPIPGAIWLFGSGIAGLVSFARRKSAPKLAA